MLIKNGTIYTVDGFSKADLLLGQRIEAIAAPGTLDQMPVEEGNGPALLDARNLLVLPGCIDIHVHAREPGSPEKEDWLTLSKAALNGGVTTVFDMPNNPEPIVSVERLIRKKVAAQRSLVNRGFYAQINPDNVEDAAELAKHANGFKLYVSETTNAQGAQWDNVEFIFKELARLGRPLVVHAEDGSSFGEVEAADLEQHSAKRSADAELMAVRKVIEFALRYKTKTHITHVSTCRAANYILSTKADYITFDVTQHHLYFNAENSAHKYAFAKVNPPLRTPEDNECLVALLKGGKVDIVASDHAPHTMKEKAQNFRLAPSGISSIDTFLPSLLNLYHARAVPLENVVECACENPARLFGLEGRGRIEEGGFADLVIVDLAKEQKIGRLGLYTKCGWNAFEGMTLKGTVVATIVNGNLSYSDGKFGEQPGMDLSIC